MKGFVYPRKILCRRPAHVYTYMANALTFLKNSCAVHGKVDGPLDTLVTLHEIYMYAHYTDDAAAIEADLYVSYTSYLSHSKLYDVSLPC